MALTSEQYNRLVEIRREISHYQTWTNGQFRPNPKLVRAVCAWMDRVIGRENRLVFLGECFRKEITSSNDLIASEQIGLLIWAKPVKDDRGVGLDSKWHMGPNFARDMKMIEIYFRQLQLDDVGAPILVGPGSIY